MKNSLIGGLLIYIILILIELIDLIRVLIIIILKDSSNKIYFIYWIMNIIFPSLNSKRLLIILLKNYSKNLCEIIENDKNILNKFVFSKEIKENDFWKYLFIYLIQIFILFLYLCLIDFNFFNKKISLNNSQFNPNEIDEDVLNERISLLSNNYLTNPFICYDLIKKYPEKDNLSINHLTFTIQQGQCFGLLGFNGAG